MSAYNTANHRIESVGLQEGSLGTIIAQRSWTYEARTVTGKGTVYVPASETRYRNDDGSGEILTSYAYVWITDSFQYSKRTTTLPVIGTGQNVRGLTLTTEAHYNSRGYLTKTVDERGTVTGMSRIDPSSRGGRNSRPRREATTQPPARIAVKRRTTRRCRSMSHVRSGR